MRHKVIVIGRPVLARAVRVQTVIAFERFKATFGSAHPDFAFGINAQPRHAFGIRDHVGLAHENRARTDIAQMVAERWFPYAQRHAVPGGPMAAHIAAGIGRHARGSADRRLHIGVGEPHAALGEGVDMRGVQMRVAVAAQVIEPQLVGHDPQDIGTVGHSTRSLCSRSSMGVCRKASNLSRNPTKVRISSSLNTSRRASRRRRITGAAV